VTGSEGLGMVSEELVSGGMRAESVRRGGVVTRGRIASEGSGMAPASSVTSGGGLGRTWSLTGSVVADPLGGNKLSGGGAGSDGSTGVASTGFMRVAAVAIRAGGSARGRGGATGSGDYWRNTTDPPATNAAPVKTKNIFFNKLVPAGGAVVGEGREAFPVPAWPGSGALEKSGRKNLAPQDSQLTLAPARFPGT
jgi:hypothetical protein